MGGIEPSILHTIKLRELATMTENTTKKETLNLLDFFLKAETSETKEVHLKRLGMPITFRTVDPDEFSKLSEEMDENANITLELGVALIVAAETTGIFRNGQLLMKTGATSPHECVKKVLRVGEIATLSKEIQELSGFDTEVAIKKAKN